jgi:proline iminopeptidase
LDRINQKYAFRELYLFGMPMTLIYKGYWTINKNLLGSFFLFPLFTFFITIQSVAQSTDSIKYENGYLYYHAYGSKNLPAVIILTGGPGNSYSQLKGIAETLSPAFRSILLEQRGTGKSIPIPLDSSTINIKAATRDIKTLMNSLNLKKAILIGHSWGGMLAMKFAAEYPESVGQLILVAPGPHKEVRKGWGEVVSTNMNHIRSLDEKDRLKTLNELVRKNEADSLEIMEFRRILARPSVFANPLDDDVLQKIFNTVQNSKTSGLLLKDIFQNYDVSKSLNKYKGPIDIITGRQDVFGFCSYDLKQDSPTANLHWINQCGHFPMYEQPEEFYKILFSVLNIK